MTMHQDTDMHSTDVRLLLVPDAPSLADGIGAAIAVQRPFARTSTYGITTHALVR
jgi:hypothetical protein